MIYVVDDDPDMRDSICDILRTQGYEAYAFEDGAQALLRMVGQRPILLITDLDMPRMSGSELLGRVRADPALLSVPVLILSGSPESAPGPTSRMTKPFDVAALLSTVRYLLAA